MVDGTELEILKLTRGPLYRRRRDQLLTQPFDPNELVAQSKNQPDRRIEIIAAILAGYKEHRAEYEAFQAEFGKINVESEKAKITGMGRVIEVLGFTAEKHYGEKILPLAWEQVLKFSQEAGDSTGASAAGQTGLSLGIPEWHIETYFHIITIFPRAESIEPMIWLIEQTSDPGLLDAAHQTLLRLPYETEKARFAQLKKTMEMKAMLFEDILASIKADKKK